MRGYGKIPAGLITGSSPSIRFRIPLSIPTHESSTGTINTHKFALYPCDAMLPQIRRRRVAYRRPSIIAQPRDFHPSIWGVRRNQLRDGAKIRKPQRPLHLDSAHAQPVATQIRQVGPISISFHLNNVFPPTRNVILPSFGGVRTPRAKRAKQLARNPSPHYTALVNCRAYSYWFSFWYPLKTGRGANL